MKHGTMTHVEPGRYRHFKGKEYEVLGVGLHSETLEEMVFYRALYSDPEFGENVLWARPVAMFLEEIEVDGKMVKRFEPTG